MGNVLGRVTAMTLITPIKPAWTNLLGLNFSVAKNFAFMTRELEQLAFIHFGRWSIIRQLPFNGPPQERDRLRYNYLLFESNFDGTWDQYIDAFSQIVPERMWALWGSSYGFPGPRPVGPFKRWIRGNEYPADHYYCAYPDAPTAVIVQALELRGRLEELVASSEDLSAEEFAVAYEGFLTDTQHLF
jgi:hypothetical protein